MKSIFDKKLHYYQKKTTCLIKKEVNEIKINNRLINAIKYSLQNQGKCIRPSFVYSIGAALGLKEEKLDSAAVALELIHTYSLIHDDLPAMDNDTLRRGVNTVHVEFDEATAILAGDAIQALGFEIISRPNPHLNAQQQIKMISILAIRCGLKGICSGQSLDMENAHDANLAHVKNTHQLKTAALFECAAELACIAADANKTTTENFKAFASKIGLAFQIKDDILDLEKNAHNLGKNEKSDIKNNKNTYPKVIGKEQSAIILNQLMQEANLILETINPKDNFVAQIAKFIINRNK